MRRIRRRAAATVLCVVALLVACRQGSGTPTFPVATAEPSATVSRPLSTESPSASPSAESSPALNRHTGNPALDAVLDAISAQDARSLSALVSYSRLACTTSEGLGGAPNCGSGEATGSVRDVLPILACEGGFVSPQDAQSFLDSAVIGVSPSVYAVTTASGTSDGPYFPHGAYSVFIQTTQQPGGGRILWVSDDGRIIAVTTGCLRTASQLYDGKRGTTVLIPPP